MIHSLGLTPDRYQHFEFAVNRFGQAFYYVKKRWKHQAAFILGVFPWLFLLALCMVVSASCFVLLNVHRRHRPLNGLAEVVLSLLAATLSLSAPVREKQHARSRSGRVILACWLLACFSLTIYTSSLLTASLMARPTWETDDTLDKMLPKLQRGHLLPGIENNSFVDVLLERANGSGSDVVDNMALAVKRSARKKVFSRFALRSSVLETLKLRKDMCLNRTLILIEDKKGKFSWREGSSSEVMNCTPATSISCSHLASAKKDPTTLVDKDDGEPWSWTPLSGRKLSIGCILLKKRNSGEFCFTLGKNTVAHALDALNATFQIMPVKRGTFVEVLQSKQADVIVYPVGLTPDRYRHFDFTVNKFGSAVYYVQKKWRPQGDFLFGTLPWLFLLALSIAISASIFALLNMGRSPRPMKDFDRLVLALMASALSLSSPLRGEHARSTTSRFVFASWMLAWFYLATYARSLLTASMTAPPSWEADDRIDELVPKLQEGRLLPCAENNSFFDFLLATAAANGSDVVDVMALAARRWAHSKRDFTGSFLSCLKRTGRGTHAFFSSGIDRCSLSRFHKTIVEGEKPIRSLIGGFPIRKDYPLRSELVFLVNRIFETGWDIRMNRLADWNCSGHVEEEATPLRVKRLLYIYCAFCVSSLLALFMECFYVGFLKNSEGESWLTA
ncbi:hypothetical protein HPB49_022475 [Dermacentor silvarum]|uniref:Uncharacterized protein n=1 Tax=Dermacentor silvarum TaxID=543639 RepID=A0ACB8CTD2_DERSI|nr:hypothetical protein HPB49_022475 [Dermacentor silvarum]